MSRRICCVAACLIAVWSGCGPGVVAQVPQPTECEVQLTPGPGQRLRVKTCDPDGRHLLTCLAGHRAVVATCGGGCTAEGNLLPQCKEPDVDLAAFLERELAAGLARCPGRLPYTVRLQIEGERKAWVIDTAKEPPMVTPELFDRELKVDATLRVSRAQLVDLVTDSGWDGMRVSFAGRMRIEGNDEAGLDAALWLSVPRSKEGCAPRAGK